MTALFHPVLTRFLPSRLPRVCVAVAAPSAAELFEKAQLVARDNNFIELRLDSLAKPALALGRIKPFFDYHQEIIVIATCRRAAAGGKFRGSVANQVDLLVKAASQGCQFLDLELQSAETLKPAQFEKLRSQAGLILSYHDFRGTRKLEETFERMRRIPADIYKVVSTAHSLADNVTMMRFLERTSEKHNMVGLCMGEPGVISRVLGVRAGSVFTYASAEAGEETAPGQIAARVLRNTYRIEQVDKATRVYAVAGDPVRQSLSPAMLNTAFRRENVNAVYLALQPRDLNDLITCVQGVPIHGLSITMPFKEAILEHLDNSDALTTKVGACNTLVRAQDGRLFGFNTDVAGVLRPLENRMHMQGTRVLVVGAGGAARAAVFGLTGRGAEVYVTARNADAAQKLARQAHAHYVQRANVYRQQFDVIINATSAGMEGHSNEVPLNDDELRAKHLFELVYSPVETRLVKMARGRGMNVILGAEMFVHQGAQQFEIWTGKPAPLDEMQLAVQHALASAPQQPAEPDVPPPAPPLKKAKRPAASPAAKKAAAKGARPKAARKPAAAKSRRAAPHKAAKKPVRR